jgi:hypothetical protein
LRAAALRAVAELLRAAPPERLPPDDERLLLRPPPLLLPLPRPPWLVRRFSAMCFSSLLCLPAPHYLMPNAAATGA